jgi:hypothetical protein
MPFTFAHPALVLPLKILPKRWFSFTGLIIGSLTPDFEYFLRMRINSIYSHTIFGAFWFDLPIGILLAFIFHNIVRDPLFDNLPIVFKSRVWRFKQIDWNRHFRKHWPIIVTSTFIGIASHIFLDSFTHKNGYFVDRIEFLKYVVEFHGKFFLMIKLIKHFCTALGLFVIAYAFFKLPADKVESAKFNIKYWGVFGLIIMILVGFQLINGITYSMYGHLAVTIISATFVSLITTPWIVSGFKKINW